MRRSVGGSFHVGLDGKSGYPDGVKAGDVVDLPRRMSTDTCTLMWRWSNWSKTDHATEELPAAAVEI